MFVAVYRFRVDPNKDDVFRRAWEAITREALDHGGSLGSALIKQDSSSYMAIARWPSAKDRDSFFDGNRKVKTYQVLMNETLVERFETLEGEMAVNLWQDQ